MFYNNPTAILKNHNNKNNNKTAKGHSHDIILKKPLYILYITLTIRTSKLCRTQLGN